jgi:malate synthase
VLVETLPAAFEMDEILHELRDHSAGLNCGRWDYIFSYIKTLRHRPDALLPDRSQITMEQPNMRAYTQLCVRTCHRRGAARDGRDVGLHPGQERRGGERGRVRARCGPTSGARRRTATTGAGSRTRRSSRWRARCSPRTWAAATTSSTCCARTCAVRAADLLAVPAGTRTEAGLRLNVRVGVQYLAAWLGSAGAVPLYNLMEDAATAEISRTQIWQWLQHGAALDDGRPVTAELVDRVLDEELAVIRAEVGADRYEGGRFGEARDLFRHVATAVPLVEFLTLPAYERLD